VEFRRGTAANQFPIALQVFIIPFRHSRIARRPCTLQFWQTIIMNPDRVERTRVVTLTDLPNVGKSIAGDLRLLGITEPAQLADRCPFGMYDMLCEKTGTRHDPCVIDVFMSITRFMDGEDARPWWAYTEERKRALKAKA
jgi:hypothetical protein